MPPSSAAAVAPDLHCRPRDPEAESAALSRIAAWCYQYSHQVCLLEDRNGLALEAGASQRLFGKPDALGRRIERELAGIGYHAATGSAPTLEAAWAAAHDARHVERTGEIHQRLGALPLACLHLDAQSLGAMEKMGLRQVRDLLRLPRRALARRFGPALTTRLDHFLGTQAHPCRFYEPPDTYSARLDLSAEISHTAALLFPLRRMLLELCGVLRGGDAAVQELHITLGHEDAPGTRDDGNEHSVLKLGLQSPTQSMDRLMTVLRERLERLRLPGPVRDIGLQAAHLFRFAPGQKHLFGDTPEAREEDVAQLTERLQARLGQGVVGGIAGVEDHRPEYSWRVRGLSEHADCAALPHRPAWLMRRPKRCDIRGFEILSGPERIESGWWDGRDCRRDYFIVRDQHGARLWAFHEYKPRRGWFVHGIFS